MASSYQKFKDKLWGGNPADRNEHLDLVSHAVPTGTMHEIEAQSSQPTTSARVESSSNGSLASRYKRGALGLLEKGNPFKGIERFGIPLFQTMMHYVVNDLFTTLLNAPKWRFLMIFFAVYMTVYFFFAIVYMFFPGYCMNEPGRNFAHGFWFSFQTASTIGYSGDMWPNPDCAIFNIVAMIEIIGANLLDYCLMGVVFARFAAPVPKAKAIRYSANAVLYQRDPESPSGPGLWCLSFRLANIRKHSLLKPEISLLLAVPDMTTRDPSSAALRFINLEVEDLHSMEANLKLGLPAVVEHVVTPSSAMYDLSLEMMEARGLEIFCFLDGMDPMTSNSVQAHNSYRPSDIRMNEHFTAIPLQENWRGTVGLDFTQFDTTVAAVGLHGSRSGANLPSEYLYPTVNGGSPSATTDPAVLRQHMTRLRSQTIRSISSEGGGEAGEEPPSRSRWSHIKAGSEQGAGSPSRGGRGTSSFSRPMDPLGVQQQPAALPPQVAELINAVIASSTADSTLKRYAALARAAMMSTDLMHPMDMVHQEPMLPVSVSSAMGDSSDGGNAFGLARPQSTPPGLRSNGGGAMPLGRSHDLMYPQ